MNEADRRGEAAEERFFRLAIMKDELTPLWYLRAKRAAPSMDVRGVDAVITLRHLDDNEAFKVPVQVKNSRQLIPRYLRKHPEAWRFRVLIVSIDGRSDEELRRVLYNGLADIRNRRIRYDEFFKEIMSQRLSARAHILKGQLERKRRN